MTNEYLDIEKKIGLSLNYKTFGLPKGEGETVLILHALTGNSTVTGENGWWKEIVGYDKAIDLNKNHVVAIDVPGNGVNGQFIEDINQYDAYLIAGVIVDGLKSNGYHKVDKAFGGSLGGGLLWEIIIDNPNWIGQVFIIAANYKTTPWLKGITHTQNEILKNSKTSIIDARKLAMLFYRSPEGFDSKFSENKQASEWLDYHGKALDQRFDFRSYRFMNHLLGSINATEGYESFSDAILPIRTNIVQVGINSDILFSAKDNIDTHIELRKLNKASVYEEIKSVHGHDAFLIESKQLEKIVKRHINIKKR